MRADRVPLRSGRRARHSLVRIERRAPRGPVLRRPGGDRADADEQRRHQCGDGDHGADPIPAAPRCDLSRRARTEEGARRDGGEDAARVHEVEVVRIDGVGDECRNEASQRHPHERYQTPKPASAGPRGGEEQRPETVVAGGKKDDECEWNRGHRAHDRDEALCARCRFDTWTGEHRSPEHVVDIERHGLLEERMQRMRQRHPAERGDSRQQAEHDRPRCDTPEAPPCLFACASECEPLLGGHGCDRRDEDSQRERERLWLGKHARADEERCNGQSGSPAQRVPRVHEKECGGQKGDREELGSKREEVEVVRALALPLPCRRRGRRPQA